MRSNVTAVPDDPDKLLRRRPTAEALTEAGYPTAPATLSTKATRGGGPPFRLYGRIPLYRWGDALAWAEGRLGPSHSSTSEAGRYASRPRQDEPTTASTEIARHDQASDALSHVGAGSGSDNERGTKRRRQRHNQDETAV